MAAHLVAAKVPRRAAAECAHQATITLCLVVGVSGSVARLALCVSAILLSLGILLLWVGTLLRELLRGGLARVLLLSVLPLALSVLVVRRGALSMLESSLCWRSVASVLLLWRRWRPVVVARALLWWLAVVLLLAVALIVALRWRRSVTLTVALTRRWRTVLVWRRVLLLAVALVVLVVRS
jgi:hypothetical protein